MYVCRGTLQPSSATRCRQCSGSQNNAHYMAKTSHRAAEDCPCFIPAHVNCRVLQLKTGTLCTSDAHPYVTPKHLSPPLQHVLLCLACGRLKECLGNVMEFPPTFNVLVKVSSLSGKLGSHLTPHTSDLRPHTSHSRPRTSEPASAPQNALLTLHSSHPAGPTERV